MLETIREFALECLATRGEAELTRRAHADYYRLLADEANWTSEHSRRLVWQELDNLRTAFTWLLEREEAEAALRLSNALCPFLELRSYLIEGRQWLKRALAASSRASAATQAKTLTMSGRLA